MTLKSILKGILNLTYLIFIISYDVHVADSKLGKQQTIDNIMRSYMYFNWTTASAAATVPTRRQNDKQLIE